MTRMSDLRLGGSGGEGYMCGRCSEVGLYGGGGLACRTTCGLLRRILWAWGCSTRALGRCLLVAVWEGRVCARAEGGGVPCVPTPGSVLWGGGRWGGADATVVVCGGCVGGGAGGGPICVPGPGGRCRSGLSAGVAGLGQWGFQLRGGRGR